MSLEHFKSRVLPVKDKLLRFAFRIMENEEEAKDVVQDVFIKVWSGKQQLEDFKNMEAWCMTLTRNLCYDRLKSKRVKVTDAINNSHQSIPSNSGSPYQSMENNDAMKNIKSLMGLLPEKQRRILQLRDIDGFSYKEIGDALELDLNQVKVNLFRARKYLRDNLLKINAYGI